jgi:hypothetical protein
MQLTVCNCEETTTQPDSEDEDSRTLNESIRLYCIFNLVVGRKILWYFKLKILRGL